MKTTSEELRSYCESIRADLEALLEADWTDEEREEREENGDPCDLYDYFTDALDWNYTISARGDLLGVRVYVALGGPNVWIDTYNGEIGGAWGGDRESIWLPSEIAAEIDSYFEELYQCTR